MLQLRRPSPPSHVSPLRRGRSSSRIASATSNPLKLVLEWQTAQGLPRTAEVILVEAESPPPVLRKGLALARFVELQSSFCEANGDDDDIEGRLTRLRGYVAGRESLLAEMAAVGDATLLQGGRNFSFLQVSTPDGHPEP